MSPRRCLPVLLACATVLALAPTARAATESVPDPVGDQSGAGLDITRATLDSRDRSIVVRVRFDEVRRGDLVVSVDPRGARGVRLVSEHRPRGTTRNFVLPFAFTDGTGGVSGRRRGEAGRECDGFRVRWNDEADRARLVLPSTCLRGGDYGAVRFTVLTERPGAGDSDLAPDNARQVSGWIPRG